MSTNLRERRRKQRRASRAPLTPGPFPADCAGEGRRIGTVACHAEGAPHRTRPFAGPWCHREIYLPVLVTRRHAGLAAHAAEGVGGRR